VAYAAALAGGLTVGWFPGWLAAVLRDALPWLDLGAVELITAHLEQGPALTRVGMLIVIGVLGPIVEELVFRGWLWRSLRRSFSGPVVILITSVLFSLVHLDPAQAIPLLFTGAFLGWARWTTGSIWTAVVIHVANNLLAIYSQLFGLSEVSSSLVALSVVGTLFLASLMWRHQTTPAMA
jgi:membrane protease YdiL (CAAX protease family)